MKKRFIGVHVAGIALIAGTLVALTVVTQNYRDLISKHFDQETYKKVNISNDDDSSKYEYYKSDFATDKELNEYNSQVCKEIESEGMVLLKNESNNLPLKTAKKLSLFSVSSVDPVLGGAGSGSVDVKNALTFKEALENDGFEVNDTLWNFYKDKHDNGGYKRSAPNWRGGQFSINEVPWNDVNTACGTSISQFNDAAIVVLSRSGGEGSDLTAHNFKETVNVEGNSGTYLELSQEEKDMLNAVNQRFSSVTVVVNSNNAMELGDLNSYTNVKSILWVGGLGQTGIEAVADAIKGTIVPSGKTIDTYAFDATSAPSFQNTGSNFWIDNKPADKGWVNEADQYTVYQEGIYVGYRYYETRYEDAVLKQGNIGTYDYKTAVQFPFGYGLSYTTFSYSNFKAVTKGDTFELSVDVTNTGTEYSGKEVVEAYFQAPYTEYDKENKVEKSSIVLGGFAKTGVIKPGEKETVKIEIEKKQLASYDYTKAKTYILDDGDYYFTIASDAHSALNNILAKKGKTTSDGMTKNGDQSFVYTWKNGKFDDKTYSKDDATGNNVTNLFDDCSLNYYDEYKNLTYLSRSNWTETFPKAVADSTDEKGDRHIQFPQKLIDDLAPKFVEDKENYTMPTMGKETPFNLASMIGKEYDNEAWEELLDSLTFDQMQEIVRMGGYGTPEMKSLNKPATTQKDGPAGISATLIGGSKGMAYPTEVVVASTWNVDLAKKMGIAIGNDAIHANVQGWYAPAMNTHRSPFAGRNFEYYSEDGLLGGKLGAAVVQGAETKGLITYVKHFAVNDTEGYIDATNGVKGSKDGISTFLNEQSMREIYLKPFEYAVKEGKTLAMMNAFNRIGTTWCGNSYNLQQGLLRDEWGFNGCTITDMAGLPNYMDVKCGLYAGTDLWLNTNKERYKLDSYTSDPQVMSYVRRASKNVLYAFCNSACMNGIGPDTLIIPIMPTWEIWLTVVDTIGFAGCLTWAGLLTYFQIKGKKKVTE